MTGRAQQWRQVRHPLKIGLRGWRMGRGSLISPRGTVFAVARTRGGLLARKRLDYQLNDA